MKRASLFACCALLACEATGFEPEYVVDTLRVLAVQADAPLASPGQSVHFTTMWADPNGAGRPIQWAWGTCLNPGSSQIPACASAMTSLALGTDSFALSVPPNALDGVPIGEVGVIFAACAGTITLAPNPATSAPVTCSDASREGFVWGGTRVTVISALANANPVIDQVTFDGEPWGPSDTFAIEACKEKNADDCPTSAQHTLSYTTTPDSIETYDVGTGPITEQLVGWFYVSQGSLTAGYAAVDANDAFSMPFTPTLSDTSRPIHVWLVVRDDRGGLSFTDRGLAWK